MKTILVLGAGRSSAWLIKYLSENASKGNWTVVVGDIDIENAQQKTFDLPHTSCIYFDALDEKNREKHINNVALIISLLPPNMHYLIAKDCIRLNKHFITASYVSDEIKALSENAKEAGIILLNEIGVDPGIDHMSAMQEIHLIKNMGGILTGFETFTGGLPSPESDDNPWHYKISWNPKNVVLAGKGVVKFIQKGQYKYIPYHNIFNRIETILIPGYGDFEGYANRDSLHYRDIYELKDIPTLFRGTLRRPGFCKAWDILVKLGMTEDSFHFENSENMTYREFTNSFLMYRKHDSVELKLAYQTGLRIESPTMERIKWMGLFDNKPIKIRNATPAQILQSLIEEKMTIGPDDKDMIVMLHKFDYKIDNKYMRKLSWMVDIGNNGTYTAMAKTVGLPLGIAAKLILNNTISATGVCLPTLKEIYEPILAELKNYHINFIQEEFEIEEDD